MALNRDLEEPQPPRSQENLARWLSLPNSLTFLRIVFSPALVVCGVGGQWILLASIAVILVITEWLDGLLARRMHVESKLGARLDTIADAVFYFCLIAAIVLLQPEIVIGELPWIAIAIGSYLASWMASLIKFHCLPSYHTWAAKGVWLLVGFGIVSLLTEWTPWPFRAAMLAVGLTNLEAIFITLVLPACRVDVPSLWHANKLSKIH